MNTREAELLEAMDHYKIDSIPNSGISVMNNSDTAKKVWGIRDNDIAEKHKKVRIILDYDSDYPVFLRRVICIDE